MHKFTVIEGGSNTPSDGMPQIDAKKKIAELKAMGRTIQLGQRSTLGPRGLLAVLLSIAGFALACGVTSLAGYSGSS